MLLLLVLALIVGACYRSSDAALEIETQAIVNPFVTKSDGNFDEAQRVAYKVVNEIYLENVKPIFKTSCFDCHSDQPRYPWYSQLPLVKDLIAKDIEHGRAVFDMSQDFPFESRSDFVAYDLVAIRQAIETGGMPPRPYRLMHWDSIINGEKKETVDRWIEMSLAILKLHNQAGE